MLTLKAYAKINFGLRILRKREDGYHDIETVFHRINVYDELTFELSPIITLRCSQAELPTDERNLCIRAAQLLQKRFCIRHGVSIFLKKNIPVGAGLGGGSSDAATTLLSLVQLWDISVSNEELYMLALQLGSDVPYFLQLGTAYATGRGEILDYFDLTVPYWIVVVYPDIHISTNWAYRSIQVGQRKSQITIKAILLEHINKPNFLVELLQNDFEPLVQRLHPVIYSVKKSLYDAGAVFTQMSGSGSAVYGLFSDESLARNLVDKLRKKYQVFITPPNFSA